MSMSMYMLSICLFARLLILLVCLLLCVCMRGAVCWMDGCTFARVHVQPLCACCFCASTRGKGKKKEKNNKSDQQTRSKTSQDTSKPEQRSPVCPLTPLFLSTLCVHLQCGKPFGNPCSHRDTAACHYGSDSASSGVMQP